MCCCLPADPSAGNEAKVETSTGVTFRFIARPELVVLRFFLPGKLTVAKKLKDRVPGQETKRCGTEDYDIVVSTFRESSKRRARVLRCDVLFI
jgi:hypothetical protein